MEQNFVAWEALNLAKFAKEICTTKISTHSLSALQECPESCNLKICSKSFKNH